MKCVAIKKEYAALDSATSDRRGIQRQAACSHRETPRKTRRPKSLLGGSEWDVAVV
ncbi:hypothetical protein SERLA73DRAFT_183464 [Serpula lacrymans var. lacrymans S7.3]|uniref:Uncharacterized protein n=2 Tax=Serpula lacrymans var. lacrymans TaxID=341189 RepID=F8PZX9_SERL3|nr:uncharacterized protein SERLADRAFT_470662 [Serpula lacrymans var. lacrymans S7.9]EGN98451.1 hypothetical protein SERLA73DRAFT_183464 [Serpula lacrymans var. lacrymans S7.3]EGO24030.1 hypothetical protein SERLADRAFT_470662 [Serpula lacrymans var. lacrymans S7.9]